MLVCPRCGTGNLPSRRSLLTHLNEHCTGPPFLSNALTTGTSTSRIIDGRHPLSVATTSHQQAKCSNAPEANVTVLTINTLHAMPSMSHLSLTQTDLAESAVMMILIIWCWDIFLILGMEKERQKHKHLP
jgi:hypothetical protein